MVKAYRPQNLREALQIRNSEKTVVLAGGTDLMVKHRVGSGVIPQFEHPVLFIGHLSELQGINIDNNMMRIGSGCTLANIISDIRLPEYIRYPVSKMASPPVRNSATIGGNICNSSPAGDTLPMLYALEACLTIQSVNNVQTVSITDFITGPGRNILGPDQILTSIEIPLVKYNSYYYRKVGSRKANSISKVSFFAVADFDSLRLNKVRMAIGAVAPTVVRSTEAEHLLEGISKVDVGAVCPLVKDYYARRITPVDDIRSTRQYRSAVAIRLIENYLFSEVMS